MWDWMINNKEWVFSGIGVAVVAALIQLGIHYRRTKRSNLKPSANSPLRESIPSTKSPDFELLPHLFEVWLHQEIPHVQILLYIVNHLSREIAFQNIRIDCMNLLGGPSLENIPAVGDVRIPPHQSLQVFFRRPLVDSEARAVERTQQRIPSNATFSVFAQGAAGHKKLREKSQPLSINGWVYGIPIIS